MVVSTVFEGSLSTVPTVAAIRGLSQRHFGGIGWKAAAEEVAAKAGGLHVMLADGSLFVLTRLTSGKVRRTTYKPGTWSFAR